MIGKNDKSAWWLCGNFRDTVTVEPWAGVQIDKRGAEWFLKFLLLLDENGNPKFPAPLFSGYHLIAAEGYGEDIFSKWTRFFIVNFQEPIANERFKDCLFIDTGDPYIKLITVCNSIFDNLCEKHAAEIMAAQNLLSQTI